MSKILVRGIIRIDGVSWDFTWLSLHQEVGNHHQFEIGVSLLPEEGLLKEKSDAFLGKNIHIELDYATDNVLQQLAFDNPSSFYGIVEGVGLSRGKIGDNIIIIRGKSLSALMDDGLHTRSFSEQNFEQILDTILEDYQEVFSEKEHSPLLEPKYEKTIPYLVQYKESNYTFLSRIAAEYNEWFYFDGSKMVFGVPEDSDALSLSYGMEDLNSFDLTIKTFPILTKFKAYDYQKHEFPEVESSHNETLSNFAELAHKISNEGLYSGSKKKISFSFQSKTKEDLQTLADKQHQMRSHEFLVLSGSSGNPHLKIGNKITLSDSTGDEFGTYFITSIKHYLDNESNYVNEFEGIPAEVIAPPISEDFEYPIADNQIAKVVDTNDPDKLGRVKVQFIWQQDTEEETSPWIRVATPYSGADKGFFLVPEKEDFVLVAFENHDPDSPYVLSGFYHGKAAPTWQDDENNVKAWVTRSGHQILLNDKEKEESIIISNPEGKNTITLSLGEQPSISIISEGSISLIAEENIILDAKNVMIAATSTTDISGSVVDISSSKKCDFSSAEVMDISGKETSIGGETVDIGGGKETVITGGEIKLN